MSIKTNSEAEQRILKLIESGAIQHDLKTLPQYFEDVATGVKKFELRIDDRNYSVGDMFVLREWDSEYTGRYFVESIGYILRDCPQYGLKKGYCIFGW